MNCNYENCNGVQYVRGYCYTHYQLIKNYERRYRNVWDKYGEWVRFRNDIINLSDAGDNSHNINLTELQIRWLNSRGGRTRDDVVEVNGEYFVSMSNGNHYEAKLVPSDTIIKKMYRIRRGSNKARQLLTERTKNPR